MADTLDGRVVLISGAGGGLGSAMARGLAAAGARMALHDLRPDAVAATAATLPSGRALTLSGDIGEEAECMRAVAETVEQFGRIDIVINNAGVGIGTIRPDYHRRPIDSFSEVSAADWKRFFRVNVDGAFHLTRAAMPHLRAQGWGRVINVTTTLGTMLRPGYVPYGCSKAALESLSAIWAVELEGSGVTVNVVVPGGPTDTGMVTAENGLDRSALLRPEVMVPPVRWLCSTAADSVNGRRFTGSLWDSSLPDEAAAAASGMPIGWPGVGPNWSPPPVAPVADRG